MKPMPAHASIPSRAPARFAFTLIELLVVISILAVLMAILLPSLGRARVRARTTVCAANLHALGLAIELYLDENDANFPRYFTTSAAGSPLGPGRLWWFGFEPNGPAGGTNRPLLTDKSPLAPYTTNLSEKIQCPDFPYNDGLFNRKFDHKAASYGYNLVLGPTTLAANTSRNRFGDRLPTIFAFADGVHFDFPPGFNEAHYLQYIPNANQPSGYAHFRHQRQAQVVYLDSHVESQPLTGPVYRMIDDSPTGNLAAPNGTNAIYGN
jgi:prepilin-type N-terminal cleavage/methylation domain-containing protein/prepilin-type processing-associated H-X9-DG protein